MKKNSLSGISSVKEPCLPKNNFKNHDRIWIRTSFLIFCFLTFALMVEEGIFVEIPKFSIGVATAGAIENGKKNFIEDKAQSERTADPMLSSKSLAASSFDKLKDLQEKLQKKEEELLSYEQELKQKEFELEKRRAELTQIRNQIEARLKNQIELNEKAVDQLIEVYSNMKPSQAAEVISALDERLAVKILKGMKKKTAGEIFGFMKPERAKALSEKIVGFSN